MSNKEPVHTREELKHFQSAPLEWKIEMAQDRVESWVKGWNYLQFDRPEKNTYISFSGGKDSTVLLDIIRKMDGEYARIPGVFCDTGLEYPEVQEFARERADVVLRPSMNFVDVVKKYGYPVISKEVADAVHGAATPGTFRWHKMHGTLIDKNTGEKSIYNSENWAFLLEAPFKISSYCCNSMKKKPFHGYEKKENSVPIVGTMASESFLRQSEWLKSGCNAFNSKKPMGKPLSFWTENDILHYLVREPIEYASVYGEIVDEFDQIMTRERSLMFPELRLHTTGCSRTGCQFCMFGCHLEKGENRFQRMKYTHPRRYEYCIRGGGFDETGMWVPNKIGLGLGFVLDYIGVKY
jgi:3'-phosphoadenosine 5'-phosphosulfate sulfotransferase (PAPS reductase)/FAD synthetase